MSKMQRNRKPRGAIDFTLLLVTLALVFIGLVMVFSSSWPEGIKSHDSEYHFFKRQLISSLIGLVALTICMNMNYRIFDKYAPIIFGISIILALLIFTPLGVTRNNARRWLNIGFTFMPSDVMKIASIIFLASRLRRKKKWESFVWDLGPLLIIMAIPCGLILLQKDLSTTVTLAATLISMIFVGGVKLSHLIYILAFGAFIIFAAIVDSDNKYRMARMTSFLNPFENIESGGWQASQSLLALGSGGFFGSGLGKSRQKFFYLPEAHNDFIFAIIGEEIGFLGGLTVLFLLAVLIICGVRIAVKARDPFGRYLATGITALIAIQSIINIGVVTSILPPTGLPLPFISYGGTSLIVNMASIGILLNISRYSR